MRKLLGVFATIGVLGAATFAFADGPAATATGKVKSVDMMRHTITLEDGSTHKLARGVSIDGVKVERVTLTYSSVGSITEVSGSRRRPIEEPTATGGARKSGGCDASGRKWVDGRQNIPPGQETAIAAPGLVAGGGIWRV
jgi:Protein of unknown function (DUF1344)